MYKRKKNRKIKMFDTTDDEMDLVEDNEIFELSSDPKKFQHENPFNKLLPYADRIDDESFSMFSEIKENLARTLVLRDIDPGFCYWTWMLKE